MTQKDLLAAVLEHSGMTLTELAEVARTTHGVESGWPGFTYTSDTCAFYDKHKELIWAALCEEANDWGITPIEFIAESPSRHTITDDDAFKNFMAFLALDLAAQYAQHKLIGEDVE